MIPQPLPQKDAPALRACVRRRFLRAGEIDHEALWLSVSAAASALGFFWLRFNLPVPACTFHTLTGCPCPGCGATRAVRQLTHGNLLAALHFNPLAVCAVAALFLFDLYAVAVLAFRLPRIRFEAIPPLVAHRLRLATLTLVAVNWLWLFHAKV